MAILNETMAIPIWPAVAALVAVVVLTAFICRLEARRQVATVLAVAALLAASVLAVEWVHREGASRPGQVVDVAARGDPAAEALEVRRAALTARATMPGSPLACLDALAGQEVESACEQAVFANPLSLAVAVSYAAARLRLLADSIAYARRADPNYAASLNDLRLAAENDAYGVYAHVLATRDGCTPERCAAFALLRDPSTLKVHLRQRTYATHVAQNRDRWSQRMTPPAVAPVAMGPGSPAPAVTTTAAAPWWASTSPAEQPPAAAEVPSPRSHGVVPPVASVLPNLDFPSASSIPAVSILDTEPKLPPADTQPPASPAAPKRPSPAQ